MQVLIAILNSKEVAKEVRSLFNYHKIDLTKDCLLDTEMGFEI